MSSSDVDDITRAEALLREEQEEEEQLELAMKLLQAGNQEERIKPGQSTKPDVSPEPIKRIPSAPSSSVGPRQSPAATTTTVTNMSSLLPSSGWECDSCLVQNKDSATKCAACETPKPGSESVSNNTNTSTTTASAIPFGQPKFSFNNESKESNISSNNEISGNATSTGGFTFGSTPTTTIAATETNPTRTTTKPPTTSQGSSQLRVSVVQKSRSGRPVTGVSPSMNATYDSTSTKTKHQSESQQQTESNHRDQSYHTSLRHFHRSHGDHALHSPIHSASPPSSSHNRPFSPSSERQSSNTLKLRILELEKEALQTQNEKETLTRKLQLEQDRAQEKEVELERVRRDLSEKNTQLRQNLGQQISDLERQLFEARHELNQTKAAAVAKESSYREMIVAGGKLPDAAHISSEELGKIQAELKSTDLLLKEMNKDNEKLHMELKIAESKYKNQIHSALEESKGLRFELVTKQEEVKRLTNAQNTILDPTAKETIQQLQAKAEQSQEKHIQEISALKYELDKLRSIKMELALRKEDQTMLGRDSLRLTLETLQEKYNALKLSKETEVKELHTKLVWYIENQQLITKYEEELKKVKAELEQVRDENICMTHLIPAGTKFSGTGKEIKMKPRPVDVKRIKELETKVAELADMIKRKSNTPSIPSSSFSSAPSGVAGLIAAIKPTMEEHELIVSLRGQLEQSELALKEKDEETLAKIRSFRQETDQMKLLYEKRLNKLQKDLTETQKKIPLTGRMKINRIAELEKSIQELRRFYTEKLRKQSHFIERLRRGETIDETEVRELQEDNQDEGDQPPNVSPMKQSKQQQQDQQESKQPSPQPARHDSLPLPASRIPVLHPSNGHPVEPLDFPRSPLRAHPHPQMQPMESRDFALFKQSLQESAEKDLHLLTSRYESQLERIKLEWENQVQLIRASHDADRKLQSSLLQQAQDEVIRIRECLTNEMQQRSALEAHCSQLQSHLLQARNQGSYIMYQELEQRNAQAIREWEQHKKQYEADASRTLVDVHNERAAWEDKLRHKDELLREKNERLRATAIKYEQLMQALRHIQQQQHQQPSHHPHKSGFGSRTHGMVQHSPLQTIGPFGSNSQSDQPGAASSHYSPEFDQPIHQRMDFHTNVHEKEEIIDPRITSPMTINHGNLDIAWRILMGNEDTKPPKFAAEKA